MKTSNLAALTKSVLAVAVVALSACGGDPTQDFVGVWHESGTLTANVAGRSLSQPQQMTTNIDLGMSPGEIFLGGSCGLTAKVRGDTATIQSGASCTQSATGGSVTMTYRSARYTLNGDSITFYASGDLLIVASGQSAAGDFSYNAMLTKVAK
jgi:hypothetical protein